MSIDNPAPKLGENIKRLRAKNGISILKLAKLSGLPQSTLSKVENGQMSLNYDKLIAVANAFSVEITELFHTTESLQSHRQIMARRSIDYDKDGKRIESDHYTAKYLSTQIKNRLMIPILLDVNGTEDNASVPMMDIVGERFAYIAEGTVTFHCEHYESVELHAGDSIYVDAAMPHAFTCKPGETGRVLTVVSSENKDYMEKGRQASIRGDVHVSEEFPH